MTFDTAIELGKLVSNWVIVFLNILILVRWAPKLIQVMAGILRELKRANDNINDDEEKKK